MDIEISSAETFDPIYSELRELKEGIVRINSFHAKAIEAAYIEGRHDATCNGGWYWEISNACASLHKESK